MKQQTTKVLVIGLDGATLRILRPLAAAGRLPALARLMERGAWGTLRSIIPPITPPAWTSFFTGRNPGKHGIYNFTASDPGQYENLRLVSTRDICCDTLWDLLGAAGRRVAVMNVPMSYPVWPVNGLMVSCMYTPRSVGVQTHPPELAAQLAGYQTSERRRIRVRPGHPEYEAQARAYLEEIERVTEAHGETAVRLMGRTPWDLFVVVFMTLDRLQHFFWRYLCAAAEPKATADIPHHDPNLAREVVRTVEQLDWVVGRLAEAAGADTTTFVVSDHGFGPEMTCTANLHREFARRGWLRREPLWFVTRLGKRTLARLAGTERRYSFDKKIGMIRWAKTRAWAELLGPTCAGIRINRRGAYREGIVTEGEYESLRAEIQKVLAELKDADGQPVFQRVEKREAVFSGPELERAPDLVAVFREGCTLTKSVREDLRARSLMTLVPAPLRDGNHHPDGLYIAAGPGIRLAGQSRAYSLLDVAPTIMELFGLAPPADMDGQPMQELLVPDAIPSRLDQAMTATPRRQEQFHYTDKEEQEIRARLENLGYLD